MHNYGAEKKIKIKQRIKKLILWLWYYYDYIMILIITNENKKNCKSMHLTNHKIIFNKKIIF